MLPAPISRLMLFRGEPIFSLAFLVWPPARLGYVIIVLSSSVPLQVSHQLINSASCWWRFLQFHLLESGYRLATGSVWSWSHLAPCSSRPAPDDLMSAFGAKRKLSERPLLTQSGHSRVSQCHNASRDTGRSSAISRNVP